uniref:Phospholipid scramblase n=1 Tax=Leptobrachium leishanense TaxID=445787 RepID=A0A8C5PMT9_9ANUR
MPVTKSQPSPFGYLKREKHIEHLPRVPKVICSCLEVRGVQKYHQDNEFKNPGEKRAKLKNEILGNPRIVAKKGSNHIAFASGDPNHINPVEDKLKMQRMLTAVEEVDESTPSELQMLAGDKQFFITSNTKSQGFSCQPERLYIISTRMAKQLLVASEDSSCLCFQLCGPARSCCLQLHDQNREEVLKFCRPYRMDVCCLWCCLMVIRVFSSSNSLIGSVQQRWSLFNPCLSVHSSDERKLMEIKGSWSAARCHSDQEFQVTSLNGQHLAIIWKRWPGYNEDYNMDHEFFGLDITASLTPPEKALLLAATFLLNYMFFEMS